MFPAGRPGLGLVMLRVAMELLLWQLYPFAPGSWPMSLLMVSSATWILLSLGLLTPIAAAVAFALVLSTLGAGSWVTAPALACALAIFFLGPGAYSVDALLFGRRVLVTPERRGDSTGDPD
jgi:hypothetical protein